MDVKETLEKIFRDVFEDEDIKLTESTTADDIEDWDSLTHIQLIEEIEQVFKVKFTLQEITGLKNVGEFITLVENKLGN